uniref:Bacterial surface antigen (D15) domain-containing protein n=1 Tax=Alexandrium catenella TaxID=2925 RepID=A0A7S1MCB8_ALECA
MADVGPSAHGTDTTAEAAVAAPAAGQHEGGEVRVDPNEPVNVVYVGFKGLKRVSPHSLIVECRALGNARTLGGVSRALQDAQGRLTQLNLFKSLRADVSLEHTGVVDVSFVVEERGRECTVSANVDKKGEVSCDLRLTQPALLGGPLSAMGSIGSTASQAHEFLLRLSTPRFLGRRAAWSFDLARSSSDEREASSYSERVTHAVMKLSDSAGVHSVFAEAAIRDLYPATDAPRLASAEVQQAQLRSVKTSLRYTFLWSSQWLRAAAPGLGASLRNDFEVAGLLGDVRFVRNEASASACLPLPWNLLWHLSGSCGAIFPTGGRPTCLQDRFFLGGASGSSTVFKGFAHRGLGPVGLCKVRDPEKPAKHLTDALGSDCMCNAFAAVSAPVLIPQGPSGGVIEGRAFGFLGFGALAPRPCTGAAALLRSLQEGARASVGLGVGMPLAGMGNLELTFAHPFWAHRHDIRQQWQLGLRLEMRG